MQYKPISNDFIVHLRLYHNNKDSTRIIKKGDAHLKKNKHDKV